MHRGCECVGGVADTPAEVEDVAAAVSVDEDHRDAVDVQGEILKDSCQVIAVICPVDGGLILTGLYADSLAAEEFEREFLCGKRAERHLGGFP